MRVLMISWEYPPHNVGGLGKHVVELVPALNRQGVEVHLLTPRWIGGEIKEVVTDDLTVHRVEPPFMDVADFFTTAARTNQLLEQKGRELIDLSGPFEAVHVHDWLVAFSGVALKHAYKIPLISTIHATEYGRNRGWPRTDLQRAIHNVEWWLTYESWRVICASEYMRNEVTQALRVPWDKVDVIPNGIDPNVFDELEGQDLTEFRARFAKPEEKIIFSIGRIVYEKGFQVLVDSALEVINQIPGTKFIIAGTGGYLNELRARVKSLGLSSHVYFTGFISDEDRNRLFKVADVAVFPSLYEPFGIVALEAMAAKTPVVVSDVGGLGDVVEHNVTGIKVYPDNPGSLAWGILHTLVRPDWSEARAENAYRTITINYNWDEIARRTRDVYLRVVLERQYTKW